MKVNLITREQVESNLTSVRIHGMFATDPPDVFKDPELKELIQNYNRTEFFTAKKKQLVNITLPRADSTISIVVAGLGDKDKYNFQSLREIIAASVKEAKKLKLNEILISADEFLAEDDLINTIRLITEISLLADYNFDKYLTDSKPSSLQMLSIICNKKINPELKQAVREAEILAETTLLARELVNEPANILDPAELAERAVQASSKYGFEIEILNQDQISELGMNAFLSVARASEKPPRFIIMRYLGDPKNDSILGFVGKGLTFDSGGYSMKTSQGMLTMNGDMGGSAAVIGALSAIAALKLPVNVVAVVAACENMVSGKGYRPGDIIRSMAGKTIYIGNTDAEGRLTLIDAITYLIEKEKVSRIVDVATLTGAAVVALGHVATAVVSNNDEFYQLLESASSLSGEKFWRLPAFPEYRELLKNKLADLTNAPGNPGTITAGMFLSEFAGDTPWLHLDIAGTSWLEKPHDFYSKGATGSAVRSLFYLAKLLQK